MRYVRGVCHKCGKVVKLDLGALSPAEGRARLESMGSFTCPGNHVELAGPLKYLLVDWETVHEDDTAMPTDEEWLAEKRPRHEHVVDTQQLSEVVDRVIGFAMGTCVVVRDGREECINYETAPSGKRYYLIGDASARANTDSSRASPSPVTIRTNTSSG